jgi:4'-phosphopantetheinyl transferase
VHVWRIHLDARSPRPPTPILSPDELARAGRFKFPGDREHFMAAREALRRILAGYLGAAAETLQFSYGAQGKPALEGSFARDGLDFNLAHSRGLALIAVSRGRRLGIDLEWIRPDVADEGIAERFFAPAEVQKLGALRREDRDLAFFRCWTRKEAYIKARGEGLSIPLNSFSVSLSPEETPRLVSVEGQPSEVSHWTLHELEPGSGFAAALAVEGLVSRLHLWNWTGALGS